MDAVYVSATQFTVDGDQTSLFNVGRVVKCDCGTDGIKYGAVQSASYSAPSTTVTLDSNSEAITSNLTHVFVGSVKSGLHGNIPREVHLHRVREQVTGNGVTFLNNIFTPNQLIRVDKVTPSAVSSTTLNLTPGKTYKLIGYVELTDNTADLAIRLNNETSGYLITYHESKDSGSSSVHNLTYNEAGTYYRVIGGSESQKISFEVDLHLVDTTNDQVFIKSNAFGYYDGTHFGREDNSGYKEVTGDISTLSLFPTSGNFSGTINLYEVR